MKLKKFVKNIDFNAGVRSSKFQQNNTLSVAIIYLRNRFLLNKLQLKKGIRNTAQTERAKIVLLSLSHLFEYSYLFGMANHAGYVPYMSRTMMNRKMWRKRQRVATLKSMCALSLSVMPLLPLLSTHYNGLTFEVPNTVLAVATTVYPGTRQSFCSCSRDYRDHILIPYRLVVMCLP